MIETLLNSQADTIRRLAREEAARRGLSMPPQQVVRFQTLDDGATAVIVRMKGPDWVKVYRGFDPRDV